MAVSFNPGKVKRRGQQTLDSALFTQSPEETIKLIRRDQIDAWTDAGGHGQPFRLYPQEKLEELAQNVRENGILNPCIVRPRNGRYQLLAGHNRVAAAGLAGLDEVPCIVKDVDNDTAELYMIDTNLYQREKILPSERAAAYAMKLEIYRRKGRRTDLTGEEHVAAAQRVAEEAGDSARSVQRYARLTKLLPELLELVDEGKIPVTVGSEIAGMKAEDQQCLRQAMREAKRDKLSLTQAAGIRAAASEDDLDAETVKEILSGQKKATPTNPTSRTLMLSVPVSDISEAQWKTLKKDPDLQRLLLETVLGYIEKGV